MELRNFLVHRNKCSRLDCIFTCDFNNIDLFMHLLKLVHSLRSIEPVLEANLSFFLQGEASPAF